MIEPSRGQFIYILLAKCLRLSLFKFVRKGYFNYLSCVYSAFSRCRVSQTCFSTAKICFPKLLLFPFVIDAMRLL